MSTYFKQVDSNSYLEFSSGHHDAWKHNVPFGQFRRVRKNCTEETTFEIQAEKIKQRFQDKGYPKGLIKNAFNRAKKLNQDTCLIPKPPHQGVSFITTFNKSHHEIRRVFRKHRYILLCDPYLKTIYDKTTTYHIS